MFPEEINWQVDLPSLANLANQASQQGAVFNVSKTFGVLEVAGEDRIAFLNNILTIDVTSLEEYQGKEALILTPLAMTLFRFWIFAFPQKILIILPYRDLSSLKDFLDKRIFVEKVELELSDKPLLYFEKASPLSSFTLPYLNANEDNKGVCIRLDCSGSIGYIAWGEYQQPSIENLEVFSLLVYEGYPHLVENGFPQKVAAMELPQWEKFFSFDKGCYPGQEIIVRSQSRNQTPAKRFVPIKWLKNLEGIPIFIRTHEPTPLTLRTETLTLGQVVSTGYSPKMAAILSWAHVLRDFATPGQKIPVHVKTKDQDGTSFQTEIEILDTYRSQYDPLIFQQEMDAGLTAYHENDFPKAQEHFNRATEINPSHPDPWEALAVIEEKGGDIDAAIRLNKIFAQKNPDAPLAKTNLSRLYMLKGWIEKAEDEKRKATILMFKASSREKKLRDQKVEPQQLQADLKRKKNMFQQVLEMDPQDKIAHFGLGKILFEEGNYLEAEEHFFKALKQDPAYSLAYSFLAECLLKRGQVEEAKSFLGTGIEQAQRQGQMIPLKAMEETLRSLSPQS